MYYSEEIFIDKFIASLALKNVKTIPFDTDSFYSGIHNMKLYFQINRSEFGKEASEISLLFLVNPLEGVFARFRDAISEQNGNFLSFDNPKYECSHVMISEDDAIEILEGESLSVSNEVIANMTAEFCKGAGL